MPLTKKGKKIMRSMKEQYGDKRGERVFYATKNKGKIKGVDMKKKPVIKANVGKMLETYSPAYSIMKGKGPAADIASAMTNAGVGGIAGAIVNEKRKQMGATPRTGMEANKMQGATPMAGGGYAKRSKPIDGAAIKGKTKGRMC